MRRLMIAAVAALAFASTAFATSQDRVPSGTPDGPYTLDGNGQCRAADGEVVPTELCPPPRRPVCDPANSQPCGANCIPLDQACRA